MKKYIVGISLIALGALLGQVAEWPVVWADTRYWAEVAPSGEVMRVVVCESAEWLEQKLGGTWVETQYDAEVEQYAGPGFFYDADSQYRFAPTWAQPTSAEDAYALGSYVYHNGAIWQSQYPANVWEPGVAGWKDPISEVPIWRQPIGSLDAYALDAEVLHDGKKWKNTTPDNVWEPGVFGWQDTTPTVGLAEWVQPTGAQDAYALGAVVLHSGQEWRSLYASNVWEPGVFGWEVVE